jgi:DNA-binding CsgD family transcriptional regulator
MNKENRLIRQYLKDCSRQDYEQLVYASKLTNVQETALQLCIVDGKSLFEAADIMNCSGRTVSKFINQAYSKISKMTK